MSTATVSKRGSRSEQQPEPEKTMIAAIVKRIKKELLRGRKYWSVGVEIFPDPYRIGRSSSGPINFYPLSAPFVKLHDIRRWAFFKGREERFWIDHELHDGALWIFGDAPRLEGETIVGSWSVALADPTAIDQVDAIVKRLLDRGDYAAPVGDHSR